MFYKAKYCAECASELQDYDESFLSRSRFCEICKSNFKSIEFFARFGGVGIAALATIFGVGSILKKPPEKPLNVAKTEIASVASAPKPTQKVENVKPEIAIQPKKVEANQQVALSSKQPETQPAKQSFNKQMQQNMQEVSQSLAAEAVYICGAKTKKGTPCSRKVKGNARCWQHLGQEAVMPAKDLRIQ
jgi:type IV secretory pathway VirB10-like protein